MYYNQALGLQICFLYAMYTLYINDINTIVIKVFVISLPALNTVIDLHFYS